MTLALVKRHRTLSEIEQGKAINKWKILRDVSEAKLLLGLKDRTLAVLDALLSFHPDNELRQDSQLVVFPSNAQLSLRAHGIAGATLRRHLALLVETGLVLRKDSANGKRYAYRGRGGEIEDAFGFDLSPLLRRAEEFSDMAREVVAKRAALRRARERLTICRRDVRKLLNVVVEQGIGGEWGTVETAYQLLVERLKSAQSLENINHLVEDMLRLQDGIVNVLNSHQDFEIPGTNGAHDERHTQSSKTESYLESENRQEDENGNARQNQDAPVDPGQSLPLGLVLRGCKDIRAYGPAGTISSWRDLMSAVTIVRSMLGISSTAFEDASQAMGPQNAAVAIACILERGRHINSAGGYLRDLARRARRKQFSPLPMLMALIRADMARDGNPGFRVDGANPSHRRKW